MTEEVDLLIRTGTLVTPRVVLLSCGHELPHQTKEVDEKMACRLCRPKKVYRSGICPHTISPLRVVLEVIVA